MSVVAVKLSLVVAFLGLLASTGCKQTQPLNKLKAIVSAEGDAAFGVVSVLNDHEKELRLIQCPSPQEMTQVETFGLEGMLSLKDGELFYENDKRVGSSCDIHSQKINMFELVRNFSLTPDRKQYRLFQALWLAMRGPYEQKNEFTTYFYKLVQDQLGASSTLDFGQQKNAIAAIDYLYNPCYDGKRARQFSRMAEKRFFCSSDGAKSTYQVRDQKWFDKALRLFSEVDASSQLPAEASEFEQFFGVEIEGHLAHTSRKPDQDVLSHFLGNLSSSISRGRLPTPNPSVAPKPLKDADFASSSSWGSSFRDTKTSDNWDSIFSSTTSGATAGSTGDDDFSNSTRTNNSNCSLSKNSHYNSFTDYGTSTAYMNRNKGNGLSSAFGNSGQYPSRYGSSSYYFARPKHGLAKCGRYRNFGSYAYSPRRPYYSRGYVWTQDHYNPRRLYRSRYMNPYRRGRLFGSSPFGIGSFGFSPVSNMSYYPMFNSFGQNSANNMLGRVAGSGYYGFPGTVSSLLNSKKLTNNEASIERTNSGYCSMRGARFNIAAEECFCFAGGTMFPLGAAENCSEAKHKSQAEISHLRHVCEDKQKGVWGSVTGTEATSLNGACQCQTTTGLVTLRASETCDERRAENSDTPSSTELAEFVGKLSKSGPAAHSESYIIDEDNTAHRVHEDPSRTELDSSLAGTEKPTSPTDDVSDLFLPQPEALPAEKSLSIK